MQIDKKLSQIFEKVKGGEMLTRSDCKYLLSFDERSFEASLIRAYAAEVVRAGNDASCILLGQIGVDIAPCPGNCRFCSFGECHTHFEPYHISNEDLEEKMRAFTREGDLYALYLMTMHEYDKDDFLRTASFAHEIAPDTTQIWANVGDTSYEDFCDFKRAGITGVYHVCRLGEGIDTDLEPEARMKTMYNAKAAGLEIYTCCEPIGPEHSLDELVDNIFIGIEVGVYQHAAMRRVAVPGAPLAERGQISELRLAQIVAGIALTSWGLPEMAYMGAHEPNALSYTSGANIFTAEAGANPRDTAADTSSNRGMDMAACRKMAFECGFRFLRRGDESKIPLNFDYLIQTNSL